MINEKLKKNLFKKGNVICECPYCGSIEEIDDPLIFKNFFRYGVEGGFFDIIGFIIKWSFFIYAIVWITSLTLLQVMNNPEARILIHNLELQK